ncbi:DUF6101 family protein [Bartonella sp. TP]|uniref:DUF6101 family protein n=1 Tax=Bartonella sp. TP TaxID=3057550 RepID=UPI0025B19498|nr:DUF6101 family protein [Bartonella sp. TP]WJW80206.1 DUF6101 family protein [Bartonella sp. TP]
MKENITQQASEEIRLDPRAFPQRIKYNCAETGNMRYCVLHADKVILYCILAPNVSTLPKVFPIRDFKGVVAHIISQGASDKSIALSLLHKDLVLSIPLFISKNLKSALLNWHLWANIYDVPMYLFQDLGKLVLISDKDSFCGLGSSSAVSLFSLRMSSKVIDLHLGGKRVIL